MTLQTDPKAYPRFSGIKTFFRLPIIQNDLDLNNYNTAILGVPFDGGTSYRPGTRFGPEHIRSMSSLGRGYYPESDSNIFKNLLIGDAGDVQIVPQDITQTHKNISQHVFKLLKHNCFPMIIGGDHSTTIGSLEAVFNQYGPFGIIHFDAHTDAYPSAWGCDNHHGTFMRLGFERGWFQQNKVLQIGLRGPCSNNQDFETINNYGFKYFTADSLHIDGLDKAKQEIKNLENTPVYISFDIDCLDPAFAPGTGTPVPGGLTSVQALHLIRAMKNLNLIGADIVEVSPPYDNNNLTSLMAVTLMGEILANLKN